jgi:hypothetical protein
MTRHSIKHAILALALVGTVAGAVTHAAPAARAASSPSIAAIADAESYGVLMVEGQGFTPRSTATVQVVAASGTVLASITASTSAAGGFVKIVSFTVACTSEAAQQVTVRAVDATQAVSNAYPLSLSSPLALAQTQLAMATSALNKLLHSANPSMQQVVDMQATVIADYARVAAAQTAAQPAGAC